MSKVIRYHLLHLDSKIGFFEMSNNRKDLKIILFDNLEWIQIPHEFEKGYYNGQRVFNTDEVMYWMEERVIPPYRQNIESIMRTNNIPEYSVLNMFLAAEGYFCSDKFHIELIG